MQANSTASWPRPNPTAVVVIALSAIGITAAWLFIGVIPQDPLYHLFADQRGMLAIPNAHNVLSNLPFCMVGLLGIYSVAKRRGQLREQSAMYLVFFGAVFFTGFGSGYYHFNPDNLTLVWDRLPMAVGFMSILAAIIDERIEPKPGLALLPLLLFAGIGSVLYWHWLDDLRPYALVQFGSLLTLLAILLLNRRPDSGLLWLALGFYVLAKLFEATDAQIFILSGNQVSGHALKHLAAAIAPLMIWLRTIRIAGGGNPEPVAVGATFSQAETQS